MLISLLLYTLGLFSKESVIVYPAIIFFLGILFFRLKPAQAFGRAAGFTFIAVIYLILYFFVFPNSFVGHVPFAQEPWLSRLISSGIILLQYLNWFVAPQNVHLLPGLYTPAPESLSAMVYVPAALCLFIIIILIMDEERRRSAIFFLLWFVLAYLPVSNIVALANPCAHRFMYFPSVGIYAILIMGLDKACAMEKIKETLPKIMVLVAILLTGFLMVQTMPMTFFWKSNFSVATQWVKHYPGFFKGYEILALEHFKNLDCEQVISYADKAMSLNPSADPRMHYVKGSCLEVTDPDKEPQLLRAVELQPNFMQAHFELGKYYYARQSYDRALLSFETAYALAPQFNTSIYLIKTYLALGQKTSADMLFTDLYEQTKNKREKRYLDEFYLKSFSEFSPVHKKGHPR